MKDSKRLFLRWAHYRMGTTNGCVERKRNRQKFGTSPVGKGWDGKQMIPTQSQLFAIPSPDQPPLSF